MTELKTLSRGVSGAEPLPRYREIRETLERAIVSGDWPPGHKLPSEKELAVQFDCARMTVSKVVGALADAGLVTRRRRAGTFVAAPSQEDTLLKVHDLPTEIRASGREYAFRILSRAERPATAADITRLAVPLDTPLMAFEILHTANGHPYAYEQRLVNLEAIPEIRERVFTDAPPGTWLQGRLPWTDAEHHISALNADETIARHLEVPLGAACLLNDRRSWHGGTIVTNVRLTYPGDRHHLVARFHAPGYRAEAS